MHSTAPGLNGPDYERDGTGEAPTLLLLRPLGGNLRFWDACRALWAGLRPLIAYDRAGAGRIPVPDHPIRRPGGIDALCDTLGPHTHYPGRRGGRRDDRRRLCRDPAGARRGGRPEQPGHCTRRSRAGADLGAAGNRAQRRRGGPAPRHHRPRLQRAVARPGLCGLYRRVPREQRRGLCRHGTGGDGTAVADDLPRIACPALVTVGAHAVLFPPEEARKVAALLPHAQYRELPGAAHFPPIQTPQLFADTVDTFIDSVRPA